MRRSLNLTISELMDMEIDVKSIRDELSNLDESLLDAAKEYMKTSLDVEKLKQQSAEKFAQLIPAEALSSPVDFTLSSIIENPLSSNSMTMDAQYFRFEQESADDMLAKVEQFIRSSTEEIGDNSATLASKASQQISQQAKNHNIVGTLIISATCSHRMVTMLDPLVLNHDKAVNIWNQTFPKDTISEDAAKNEDSSKSSLNVISGMVKASSFIGMVHILDVDSQKIGPIDQDEIDKSLRIDSWLQGLSGGIGVGEDSLDEVRKYITKQQITAHVSIITSGVLPNIASNEMAHGITQLANPPADSINNILSIDADQKQTLDSGSESNIHKKQFLAVQQARLQTCIQSLDSADRKSNKVMDINSLMTAFDNFLSQIRDEKNPCGIPSKLMVTSISKKDLLNEMSVRKKAQHQKSDSKKTTETK
ncbi:hypothetical protein [Ekhidna sp. To15]|uniref:hypothetical protein n=1 Tax=Ekhidna sp. To15 TaxID=3395267 RepID=UPI003F51C021